ncbi:hypothetical protein BDV39DRAFT_185947 [Aspergillus sergii]|uniref:Uncharacterized protein n=1 Tax=Aspergillus sergii TaxID=1034303 RepID=A0A5N6WPJ3_9EURO|nr:hypothetical protein BDV39DRAFT_185947 [Aspergillus sergii]
MDWAEDQCVISEAEPGRCEPAKFENRIIRLFLFLIPLGLDRVNGVRFSLAGALWILSEIFFWLWSRTSADWMDCLPWWLTGGLGRD